MCDLKARDQVNFKKASPAPLMSFITSLIITVRLKNVCLEPFGVCYVTLMALLSVVDVVFGLSPRGFAFATTLPGRCIALLPLAAEKIA